jgi:hypothetical protein
VLAIGNFMNYGTKTGNTVAFDIDVLPKLIETRANVKEQGIGFIRYNYLVLLFFFLESCLLLSALF